MKITRRGSNRNRSTKGRSIWKKMTITGGSSNGGRSTGGKNIRSRSTTKKLIIIGRGSNRDKIIEDITFVTDGIIIITSVFIIVIFVVIFFSLLASFYSYRLLPYILFFQYFFILRIFFFRQLLVNYNQGFINFSIVTYSTSLFLPRNISFELFKIVGAISSKSLGNTISIPMTRKTGVVI